jgi:5-methylcytosine-specific restriction endonuclease McrA
MQNKKSFFERFKNLDYEQKQFIEFAVIEQMKFADIQKCMQISDRKRLSFLWNNEKELREFISAVRQIWRVKMKGDTSTSFYDFFNWYCKTEEKCCHCGITQEQINSLFSNNLVKTKRTITRGRKLEIERVAPNEKYNNLDNLKYSCYWCNNAKTDEFNDEEFRPIGQEIKKVWEKRLGKKIS